MQRKMMIDALYHYSCNASTVLHQDLEPESKLDASTKVNISRTDAEKHFEVVGGGSMITSKSRFGGCWFTQAL